MRDAEPGERGVQTQHERRAKEIRHTDTRTVRTKRMRHADADTARNTRCDTSAKKRAAPMRHIQKHTAQTRKSRCGAAVAHCLRQEKTQKTKYVKKQNEEKFLFENKFYSAQPNYDLSEIELIVYPVYPKIELIVYSVYSKIELIVYSAYSKIELIMQSQNPRVKASPV